MVGAAAGSLVTVIQTLLLLFQQDTICFNNGCQVVESMTTVPPTVFNLAGFLFFQAIFWTLYYTKLKDSYWPILSRTLLLSGLAAEAVLVGYQHFVIQVFCSYCLVIFGIVVFLNLLQGFKHILFGAGIFLAVQIGFFSLQFTLPQTEDGLTVTKGIFTTMEAESQDKHFYLFFSSTCEHCEEVIQTLEEYPRFPISFNPVDKVESVDIPGGISQQEYDSKANLAFLSSFGIKEIPALLVQDGDDFSIIRGKNQIIETIKENCYPAEVNIEGSSPVDFNLNQALPVPAQPEPEESCTIGTDC